MMNVYTTASNPVVYYIKPLETSTCTHNSFCLTFEQFAANISQHLRNQTILSLNTGIYHISIQQINITNVDSFSITSETKGIVTCIGNIGFNFTSVKEINFTKTKFIGCGHSFGVINLFKSSAIINSCSFINSTGSVVVTKYSKLIISQSIFKSSYARLITAQSESNVFITNTIFESNTNEQLLCSILSNLTSQKCTFHNNTVNRYGRLIKVSKSIIVLNKCEFTNNNAKRSDIVESKWNTNLIITETQFKHNLFVRTRLLVAINTQLIIAECIFINNTVTAGVNRATEWGLLHIYLSELATHKNVIITRNYATKNSLAIYQSTVQFNGIIEFSHNIGAIFITESKVTFNKTSKFFNNEQNTSVRLGGAITIMRSVIYFGDTVKFYTNKAWKNGGAINAIESKLYTHGNAIFNHNTAEEGGALHLDRSLFTCESNCTFIGNTARTKGGAIHAIDSIISIGKEWFTYQDTITSPRLLSFLNNHAKEGGGISLERNAEIHGPLTSMHIFSIQLINNTADKGAAIYINDYGNCNNPKCFLRMANYRKFEIPNSWVIFNVTKTKYAIYGGLLDRCLNENGKYTNPYSGATKALRHFRKISGNYNIDRIIASDPVKLCYCSYGKINCTHEHSPVKTEKGNVFNVLITAVDQAGHQVNATVKIDYHYSAGIHIGDRQYTQKISNECSNITLNVYSLQNHSVMLDLLTNGPCNSTDILKLQVTFLPCTCPIGFEEITGKSDNCMCDCDTRIQRYITECNESTKSIIREGNFWINIYDNSTSDNHNRYIIYHNCPHDYCVSSTEKVSINSNNIHGADAQCAFNRTGLLCSTCKPPFSTLSLASSHCLTCTNNWPSIFIVTILAGGLCGIALVALILVLNLTIAVGTLNGLVFYANIVASNNIIYYRTGTQLNAVLSVFIAWLNLETGIQVNMCVIKGLDTYSKVWLQFLFPTYLIFVLFAIIAISKYSSRFARLIGK